MKRQNSQQSSSYRGQNQPENVHAKNIGCMSGIFNLLCKYHSNRKSITSGKRQQTNEISCPRKLVQPALSTNLPTSSTLPAEIRFRDSPPLVARLMGLNETPTPPETAAEKRRQILGALEKCDQDLKALKKIIEVVRSAEQVKCSHGVDFDERVRMISEKKQFLDEEKSPVSVLDEFNLSPLSGGCLGMKELQGKVLMHQPKQQPRKNLREASIFNLSLSDRNTTEVNQRKSQEFEGSPFGCSKAMVESVNEVCMEIACGEKREFGRIGLALQDFIYKELVEEMVKEMGHPGMHALPFHSCKRRLFF